MLDSARFKASPKRAKLLEFVVNSALEHTEISEDIIGYALFPGYEPDVSNDVRVTATNLRSSLAGYCAEEGATDPIKIELPRGASYRPVFSYNPRSAAYEGYVRGMVLLSQLRIGPAEEHFFNALDKDPNYADAYLGLVSAYLFFPICGELDKIKRREHVIKHLEPEVWVPLTSLLLEKALAINRKSWRAYILRGVLLMYQRRWDEAERSFDIAIELSPEETRNDPWYAAYLATIGELDQACTIFRRRAKEHPDNPAVQTQYGFMMYATRQFAEAEEGFVYALDLDERCWAAWLGYALLMMEAHKDKESTDWILGMAQPRYWLPMFFPGLLVLWRARAGQAAADQMSQMFHFDLCANSFNIALSLLAFGQPDEAVGMLKRAFSEYNPLVLWLHLWPVFDPLREHKGFKKLIQETKLPGRK
jgi:Tfp pilus assembly protein PilF